MPIKWNTGKSKLKQLELEILAYNYWEHYKREKELALILPLKHPQRVELLATVNDLREQMNALSIEIKNDTIQEEGEETI